MIKKKIKDRKLRNRERERERSASVSRDSQVVLVVRAWKAYKKHISFGTIRDTEETDWTLIIKKVHQ